MLVLCKSHFSFQKENFPIQIEEDSEHIAIAPLTLSVPGGVLQDPPYGKSDAIFLWMRKFFPILDEFLS